MKGNPLLRLGLAVLLLGVILWPVWSLTRPREVSAPAPGSIAASGNQAMKSPMVTETITLQAIPPPVACSIVQNGVVLLSEKNCFGVGIYRTEARISRDCDLVISAEWENEDQYALRAEVLLHDADKPVEKSFWGRKSLQDTLSLPYPRKP
jgi:hypothetical protein